VAFAVLATTCVGAAATGEYDVKAAYLLNFTKFVEWPASAFTSAEAPIAICIVGSNPFGTVLQELVQGEEVNGRKVVVRYLSQAPAPRTCQVVFLPADTADAAKIVRGLGPGVLSVGEGGRFLHEGGAIAFLVEQRRVRFDIRRSAAEAAGLRLSSKLLTVARAVEK
jgi:hypothetical protein